MLFSSYTLSINRCPSGPRSDWVDTQTNEIPAQAYPAPPYKPFLPQTQPPKADSRRTSHLPSDSLSANHYLLTRNGVQDPRTRVCDSRSWEKVINFVWKHGDFILTIHSVVAKFGYPLIKDFLWLYLDYVGLKGDENVNHSKEQLVITLRSLLAPLHAVMCRNVEIPVYWLHLHFCSLWNKLEKEMESKNGLHKLYI